MVTWIRNLTISIMNRIAQQQPGKRGGNLPTKTLSVLCALLCDALLLDGSATPEGGT